MQIVPLLHFGNVALCALLAVHLLLARGPVRTATVTLAVNYALFAVQSALLIAQWQFPGAAPAVLRPVFALVLGPAMLMHFRRVIGRPFRRAEWLHGLPACVVMLLFLTHSPWLRYLNPLILASFAGYCVWGLLYLRAGPTALEGRGIHALSAYRWLSILVLLMALNLLLECGITLEIARGVPLPQSRTLLAGSVLFLFVNAATVLALLRRSQWLQWMFEYKENLLDRYRAPRLGEDEARALLRRWETLLDQEELFKVEFGITLAQGARKLGVPARDLSSAINSIANEGFSQHLNRRRVNEAIAQLERRADAAITDVMLEAGFSSKSHFNKEFLRVTGMSPSAYRLKQAQRER